MQPGGSERKGNRVVAYVFPGEPDGAQTARRGDYLGSVNAACAQRGWKPVALVEDPTGEALASALAPLSAGQADILAVVLELPGPAAGGLERGELMARARDEGWRCAMLATAAHHGGSSLDHGQARDERTLAYDADDLVVHRRELRFLEDPRFLAAYWRGMDSGHHMGRARGSRDDLHIEWRVRTVLWAAAVAARLPGDFVECGVNTGIYSLAVCEYLGFNALDRSFWLFDTFRGIPAEQISDAERRSGRSAHNEASYSECFALAQANFAPFPRAHLVRGRVPDTLADAPIERVAYLSLDMNIAEPEVAALEHFWDRLSPGAPVLFDDYARGGYGAQTDALDAAAAERGAEILALPTGQGLLMRPPDQPPSR